MNDLMINSLRVRTQFCTTPVWGLKVSVVFATAQVIKMPLQLFESRDIQMNLELRIVTCALEYQHVFINRVHATYHPRQSGTSSSEVSIS